jgi:hypothetical protein
MYAIQQWRAREALDVLFPGQSISTEPAGVDRSVSAKVHGANTFADVPPLSRPLIRQSAIMVAAAKVPRLKKRTLTNLYNERPQWLKLAHEKLDRAVLAAYADTDPAGGWCEDCAAVWIDAGAAQPLPAEHPLFAERQRIERDLYQSVAARALASTSSA